MRSPPFDHSGAGVARLAVGQQRDARRSREVEAVELVELVAARVLGEDEGVAVFGLVRGPRHAVGEERQLRARRRPGTFTSCTCGVSPKRVPMSISRRAGCQVSKVAERNSV